MMTPNASVNADGLPAARAVSLENRPNQDAFEFI
jgi:hypothetical protein